MTQKMILNYLNMVYHRDQFLDLFLLNVYLEIDTREGTNTLGQNDIDTKINIYQIQLQGRHGKNIQKMEMMGRTKMGR